jgi:DNA polymerase III delta prime subunit
MLTLIIEPRVPQPETARPTIEATTGANVSAELQNALDPTTRKTKKPKIINPLIDPNSSSVLAPNLSDRAELLDVDPNSGRRKRRKTAENKVGTKGSEDQTEAARPIPKGQPRQRKLPGSSQNDVDLDSTTNAQLLDPKREGYESHLNVAQEAGEDPGMYEHTEPAELPLLEASTLLRRDSMGATPIQPEAKTSSNSTVPSELKPKKILRLNPKTGTIGSPPTKKPRPALEDPIGKKGRRAKVPLPSNEDLIGKTKIVTIRYSHGKGIGQKIDQIMNSPKSIIPLPSKVLPEIQKPPTTPTKPKALHPLFLGKAAVKKTTTPQAFSLKDVIDLESPRPRSRGKSPPTNPAPVAFSAFGVAKIMKFPGAIEPAWPWRDMVHIRGFDQNEVIPYPELTPLQAQSRKFKYQAIEVAPAESIIGTLANDLCIKNVVKEIREINPDEDPVAPACLRVPKRHCESGLDIQKRVLKELHTQPVSLNPDYQSPSDEIQATKETRVPFYPAALSKVYTSIANSVSAFDYGQCETQAWIQKYAPKAAAEVLQAGSEAHILKAWLQKLTVQSVEAGLGDRPENRGGSSKSSKSEKPGKRKRKSKKLDDFVVSTEDEDDDMDEITESEDGASPHRKLDLLKKKTVIRAGDAVALGSKEPGKLSNTVLISGPHGCGKTAAVYAVARELGFEVFEINSSGRRNGKDILERVGDMTRNHQVQRSSNVPTGDPIDDDKQRIDDALASDLKSGRQGTMNSFFKPKQEAKQETKPKPNAKTGTKQPAETQKVLISKPPVKQQKQSLILLEEVDILYKEDTQFWATVLSLVSTSKRPIVMTCNDESVVPIASLTVHAILRFAPPPVDLAVDYMLLVAACEGHVLRRESVKSLYGGRNLDLRAALTELNFWCQFAVGDVNRGLNWYYPRWSRHEDLDKKGNTIRVVSEETYQSGMGWLSQDFLESDVHHLDIEEEILHEVYDGWHADVGESVKSKTGLDIWAKKAQTLSNGKNDDRAVLNMYADFAEAMSSADLCSGGMFAPDNQVSF